ncbi:hypothetical protein [Caulobacter sp. NIBR1757]|uniref:hypothetical protein n=1 Tax=Caulobacter sp. NIBR1757 TaxID=3016000 RepID=UPI0022F09405|nr:hypothetical protein [Caulobacter sp. NIBR1757]WGM37636.1 hypothetical protein AMEJIAPC_00535 [Caulobacter sp. NIBR1757]
MTKATQSQRTSTAHTGLVGLLSNLATVLRATSEASVRIAYDKPWLRDSRA